MKKLSTAKSTTPKPQNLSAQDLLIFIVLISVIGRKSCISKRLENILSMAKVALQASTVNSLEPIVIPAAKILRL